VTCVSNGGALIASMYMGRVLVRVSVYKEDKALLFPPYYYNFYCSDAGWMHLNRGAMLGTVSNAVCSLT
jgi:hypothetical protein